MTRTRWLRDAQTSFAAERILDAAGELFAERGVTAVGMADVARGAGCSRATLYRYFESREALRTAFVHRQARRVGAEVAVEVDAVADRSDRLVQAMTVALDRVRRDPTLLAWFTAIDAGGTSKLAQSSPVIEAMVAAFLGEGAEPGVRRRAGWVVRVMVSLLADPGTDPDDERALIAEFVVPVVLGPA